MNAGHTLKKEGRTNTNSILKLNEDDSTSSLYMKQHFYGGVENIPIYKVV